jgi:hypothetical protein
MAAAISFLTNMTPRSATKLSLLAAAFLSIACKQKPPAAEGSGSFSSASGIPLQGRSMDGKSLLLRDGSAWSVQPVSQGLSIHWMAGDPIEPHRVNHPVFPFVLVNSRAGNSVLARLAPPPGAAAPPYGGQPPMMFSPHE